MIKRIIIRLIYKYNLFELYEEYLLNKKKRAWFDNLTSLNKEYYENGTVINLQNDKNKILLESNSVVRGHLKVLKYGGEIKIGKNSYVGNRTEIWSGCKVEIMDNVLISDNVFICDTNSHEINKDLRINTYLNILKVGAPTSQGEIVTSPVIIKNDAWISYGVIILKGVTIGEGAIIGAGSVVLSDIGDYVFAAGNPAKFIRNVEK